MKDNPKYVVFFRLALLSMGITLLISACNPFQQAEEAAKAKKTSDSLMKEFNKVNEDIKRSDSAFNAKNDTMPMPLPLKEHKGVGAIK